MTQEEIQDIIFEELDALMERITNNIVTTGEWATGETAASMAAVTEIDGDNVRGSLEGRSHFETLETGVAPWKSIPFKTAKDGHTYPAAPKWFAEKIGEWADAKGVDGSPYAIALKIILEGTKLYNSGGRSDVYSNEIQATVDSIGNRIIEKFNIDTINLNR